MLLHVFSLFFTPYTSLETLAQARSPHDLQVLLPEFSQFPHILPERPDFCNFFAFIYLYIER